MDMKAADDVKRNLVTVRDVMKENGFEHVLLEKYAKDPIGIMKKMMDYSDEKYVCVSHIDSWSNNMMFKYEMKNGEQILSDLKILDWQAWTIAPPIMDLMVCLFTSCSEEVLNNIQANLKVYHESLSRTLALYKLKVEEVYPFQEMMKQFQKYYDHPVMFGMLIRKKRSIDETFKADVSLRDDTTAINALRGAKFDKDYLFDNIKCVLVNIDRMINNVQK